VSLPRSTVHVGTRPQVQGLITNATSGAPVNPTVLTVIVRNPDDTQDTYTSPNAAITNPETGTWLFRFPAEITVPGTYWIYFNGDDPADVADEIKLVVRGVHVDVA
jgi:hypothetical protein